MNITVLNDALNENSVAFIGIDTENKCAGTATGRRFESMKLFFAFNAGECQCFIFPHYNKIEPKLVEFLISQIYVTYELIVFDRTSKKRNVQARGKLSSFDHLNQLLNAI